MGQTYKHRWQRLHIHTHGWPEISSSIPRAAIRRNFLGSISSNPVAGHPEEHAPQVRQRFKLPPWGNNSFTLVIKMLLFSFLIFTGFDISFPSVCNVKIEEYCVMVSNSFFLHADFTREVRLDPPFDDKTVLHVSHVLISVNGRFWFPARPERVFSRPSTICRAYGAGRHSALFRGLKTSENAAGNRRMPFMDGTKLGLRRLYEHAS
jgi:hypothetical protein